MDEIVELMARAICTAQGENFDAKSLMETGHGNDPEDNRESFRAATRAALSALYEAGYSVVPNEPTNVMVEVGTEARWRSAVRDANNIREIYRAMIKTALEVK